MSKEFDKFSAGFNSMSMFDNDSGPEKTTVIFPVRKVKPTRGQVVAVREARKEKRGRGKSLGERRSILIRVSPDLDKAIEEAMYNTGRTQNDVICDAIINYLKIDI